MHNKKLIAALTLCVLTCAMAVGCGSKGTAVDYVEGVMDLAYASDVVNDKALDMSDDQKEKAKEQSVKAEAEFLAYYLNIEDPSQQALDILAEACQELYKAAAYSVTGNEDEITVTVKPLVVHTQELEDFVQEFNVKKFVDADSSCTDEAFAKGVAQILKEIAKNPEYEEVKTIKFNIGAGANKDYSISSDDLKAIDEAIFAY